MLTAEVFDTYQTLPLPISLSTIAAHNKLQLFTPLNSEQHLPAYN